MFRIAPRQSWQSIGNAVFMECRGRQFLSLIIGLPEELIWPQSAFRVSMASRSMGAVMGLHVPQRVKEGDAYSSTFALAGRRRPLARRDAIRRKHILLLHTDTDAPPAREAASTDMHTDGTCAPCRRIRIRNAAFVAHRADPDDNGISVARFGFEKASASRVVFRT
jgi:hypothetical protein